MAWFGTLAELGLFIPNMCGMTLPEMCRLSAMAGWRCHVQAQAKSIAPFHMLRMKTPSRQSRTSSGDFLFEVFMTKRFLILCSSLIALSLTACSATGPVYTPTKAQGNEAKVVVYRSPNGGPAPIYVNGTYHCRLPSSGHFVLTVEPRQQLVLSSRFLGDLTPSTFVFTPQSGRTYYVRTELSTSSLIAGSLGAGVGGFIGGSIGSSASGGSTYVFRDGVEAEALTTRYSGGCQ